MVGKLDGPATVVGTCRTVNISKSQVIVEKQIAREVTKEKMTFSYAVVNDDNPFGLQGYRANVTVFPLTEIDNQCFWFAHDVYLCFLNIRVYSVFEIRKTCTVQNIL